MQKKTRAETKETPGTKGAADRKEAGHLGVMYQNEGSEMQDDDTAPQHRVCVTSSQTFKGFSLTTPGSNQNPLGGGHYRPPRLLGAPATLLSSSVCHL